jgi:GDPmannose 4,6-dehydratase
MAGRLLGDATKARRVLDWSPCTSFAELVRTMMDADLALVAQTRS